MEKGGIVVFGGTAEGRELALALCRRCPGREVWVSVATGCGRELLEQGRPENLRLREGRLDREGMAGFFRQGGFAAAVDATHPYAREVSQNLRLACREAGLPCLGLRREATPLPGCRVAEDIRGAAAVCRELPGNILLATGAKELPAFCRELGTPERVFPRVLPVEESLRQCRRAGIPARQIVAMMGPFSRGLNLALMEQLSIAVLVTKDGGAAGGMPEKLDAAREHGAEVVVIRRPPQEEGLTQEEMIARLAEILGLGQEGGASPLPGGKEARG